MYLLDLYTEWFSNPNWWFNATSEDDNYLYKKYDKFIHDPLYFKLNDLKEIIGYIILHDQIPRHINRITKDIDISKHLVFALEASIFIINNPPSINSLSIEELCFVLLPLRHNNDIINAINIMWKFIKFHNIDKNNILVKRFLKVSYDKIDTKNQLDFIVKSSNLLAEEKKSDSSSNLSLTKESAYIEIEKLIYDKKPKNIILSLSMGVDSAICSLILNELKIKYNFNLFAVHINYRDSELNFIENWCNYLEIPLYIRSIKEINREQCMKYNLRDTFETYTKNIRLNTYKTVWKDILELPGDPIILLGHNKNDCFENILTNITQQKKYNNLQGMKEVEEHDNLIFWRPLLTISKEEIRSFAKKYNIPHLPNSTPSWSQRGKIRDNIRPVLEAWDPQCIESFYKLSDTMSELTDILNDTIDIILKSMKISNFKDYIIYNLTINKITYSSIFWYNLFMRININVSHKSINSFIIRLKQNNNLENIILSKNINLKINKNNIIINEKKI